MKGSVSWLGFWIFLSVFAVCEAYLYDRGHETFLWKHKTAAEKQIQAAKVANTEQEKEQK